MYLCIFLVSSPQKYSIHYDGDAEPSEYYSKDGRAKVGYANGDTFDGELVDGQKHGNGQYVWKVLAVPHSLSLCISLWLFISAVIIGRKGGEGHL